MGFSKKGLKRKQKSSTKGAKAKTKEKLGKQIEGRKAQQASKRAAKEAQAKPASRASADSVDELFASLGDEDLEEDAEEEKGEAEEDKESCSDSSDGAFHDVDDGDDLAPEDLAALDDEEDAVGQSAGKKRSSEAKRHEKELQAIKERDPEFYKFLVEQDKQLLDFRAEEVRGHEDDGDGDQEAKHSEDDGEEDFAAVQAADKEQAVARLLTLERFKQIEASAQSSFTAFKAALNAFHTAVRSIEGAPEVEDAEDVETAAAATGDEEAKRLRQKAVEKQRRRAEKERNRSATSLRRKQRAAMTIDSEATFSEVLEWSIANIPALLRHYAGELLSADAAEASGSVKSKKGKRKSESQGTENDDESAANTGVFDPSRFSRWRRIKVLCNIFWDETLFLLNHLQAPEMLEFVLRNCSSPEALSWLWPFKHLRKRYLRRCCSLWATGSSTKATQPVRLLAFLFIRNSAAMALQAPNLSRKGKHKDEGDVPQLEELVRSVLRTFAEVASAGYSWKSVSNFRFMENCILELFRLEDATAYRVGYVCIRQLALILRNACVASSQGATSGGTGGQAKKKKGKDAKKTKHKDGKGPKGKGAASTKKRSGQLKQVEALVSWPFVRSLYLWTKAVGTVAALKPLAYPLSMIVLGAVKSRLTSLQHFPFVYHGLHCLNRLSQSLEAFVPVSAHLLKSLQVLMQAFDKEQKLRKSGKKRDGADDGANGWGEESEPVDLKRKAQATVAKAPDIEVLLHFPSGLTGEALTLEAVGSSLCGLFTDHLGLMSRSPAFPEIAAPVLLHLRRHSKHCRSEALRRQLKVLLSGVEQSSDTVRRRREQLQEPPPPARLFFLGAEDTPLARSRVQLLKRKAAEERQCVEAEIKADKLDEETREGGSYQDRKKAKRKREREAKQNKEATKSKSKGEAKKSKKAKASTTARAAGAAADVDVVEEMGFSSGED